MKTSGLSIANFEELLRRRGNGVVWPSEHPSGKWLSQRAVNGLQVLKDKGLPTRRWEAWRYTGVQSLTQAIFEEPALRTSYEDLKNHASLHDDGASEARLVFVNGGLVSEMSVMPKTNGVRVGRFRDLAGVESNASAELREHFAAFTAKLEQLPAPGEPSAEPAAFSALNTSFAKDGIYIAIEAGVKVADPIRLIFISDGHADLDKSNISFPRIFAWIGRHAEATIVEKHSAGEAGRYFSCGEADVIIEDEARLTYYKLQNECEAAGIHIAGSRFFVARGARVETFHFGLGAVLSRQDHHVKLLGEGAEAVVDGLYLARDRQHIDYHTVIEHRVPNTRSMQQYKGILDNEARAVFNGKVRIEPGAQKSDAAQLNNNLVLSLKAEVDTKPELEIFADDVKATHGATIGQLDEEQVFYLQARAINRRDAVSILARGFAYDVILRLSDERLRTEISSLVDGKFAAFQMEAK